MDSEKIDGLLNKYWNCETSLEEEQQLKSYFRNSAIPEQYKETAALFRHFEEQKEKSLTDASFDRGVIRKIQASKKGKVSILLYNSMRIAAGIIVLVLAVWLVRMEVRETIRTEEIADTYSDPKVAFEETKKALMMISRSFGTAEEQAKKINLFNEAKKEIEKVEIETEL
ncbi:MAG TPA: hypothetical protein VFO54_09685 [Chryseosolibacter sp.]|nr:hypothetical protein [Chryseosolibacter sp.]